MWMSAESLLTGTRQIFDLARDSARGQILVGQGLPLNTDRRNASSLPRQLYTISVC